VSNERHTKGRFNTWGIVWQPIECHQNTTLCERVSVMSKKKWHTLKTDGGEADRKITSFASVFGCGEGKYRHECDSEIDQQVSKQTDSTPLQESAEGASQDMPPTEPESKPEEIVESEMTDRKQAGDNTLPLRSSGKPAPGSSSSADATTAETTKTLKNRTIKTPKKPDLAALVTEELHGTNGLKLSEITVALFKSGYKHSSQTVTKAVHKTLAQLKTVNRVNRNEETGKYHLTGPTLGGLELQRLLDEKAQQPADGAAEVEETVKTENCGDHLVEDYSEFEDTE
jgi:hypothetical protein